MDNVMTTVLPSAPKRPRLDCIAPGDEGRHRPSEVPPSWGTERAESPRVNPEHAAQRHSDAPQWEEYNRGERCEADDSTAVVADASASSESDSGTASSHADGSAVAARVSSAPGAGGGAEEEERRQDDRIEESTSPSRREEESPSATAPVSLRSGAVAAPRRVTPLTWPGLSPEGRRWPAGAGPPPADEGEGARPEGGGGHTGEPLHILLPGEVDEVEGRCVYGEAEQNGRSRPSLGGGGEGDEEGDGHRVRECLPLKGGGGGEGEAWGGAAPAADVIMTPSPSDQEAVLDRLGQNSCTDEENETLCNAEAWRGTSEAEQGSAHPSPAPAGPIGSPVVTHDALLDTKAPGAAATKAGPRPVIDDPRGGEGTHGTPHKMADQASGEALMPAQIPQGRPEGANDTGPFRVMDPAVCSQAGGQDGEKSSTWRGAAGVGLSPSGVRELAQGTALAPIPESVDGSRSVPDTKEIPSSSSSSSSSSDQACSSEELTGGTHDTCPSATGEMCFSFFTNGSLNETKRETRISESGPAVVPVRPSCPANSLCESFEHIPPGGEIEEQSLTPAGALGEPQDLIEWSQTGQDPLSAQVETKITERILVKTICFEGEQLTPVIDSPDKIRQHRLTAATNQQPNASSVVPASGLVSDWFNATMGESCYQSLVLPSLHPEDEPGPEACVLSCAPSGYRPAITAMDLMEHHPSPRRTAAGVPGPQRCTTYGHDALIRIPQERFQPSAPPPPSAPGPPDRAPAAADTFQKIQLSSWDDDEECGGDEGPGHSPVLTGSAELWKSSRRLPPRALPGAQSPGQRGGEPGAQSPGQRGGEPGAQSPGQRGGEPGAQSPGQRGGEPGAQSPGQRGGEPPRLGEEPGAQSPGQRGGEPPRAGEEPGAESPGQRGADAVVKPPPQREETGRRCLDSISRPGEIPRRASTVSPACRPPVTQPVPAPCWVFNSWSPAAGGDGGGDGDDDDDGEGEVPLAVETFQGFERKQQFDEVVQELQQFFEIGMSDPLDVSSSDWGSVLNGAEETGAPGPGGDQTSPLMEHRGEASSDIEAAISLRRKDNDEDGRGVCGLMAHGCSPEPVAPPQDTGTSEPDQQVPPADWRPPCLDGEDSMYSAGEHGEENEKKEDHIIHRAVPAVPESREKKEKEVEWSPSFQSQLSGMQYGQRQTDPHRRLEPLKTCARPIRVGLSKRAKTSHLHRSHPYK
ncbi:unnamed protein product [Arctogadus glacialis]